MTTILADYRLGVMVSDSNTSDTDRVWSERKVWRWKGSLIGLAGDVEETEQFMIWFKKGGKAPNLKDSFVLVMSSDGLFNYLDHCVPQKVKRGIESIGSGAKAAMCAYEALAFTDPVRAVKIVCKHDNGSRPPVRAYRMKA